MIPYNTKTKFVENDNSGLLELYNIHIIRCFVKKIFMIYSQNL